MIRAEQAVVIVLDVSTRTPHGWAVMMVFVLLGGVTVLTMAPFELGTIRLAGVSLLWWYGVVVVPVVAVGTAALALVRGQARASTDDPPASSPAPAPE